MDKCTDAVGKTSKYHPVNKCGPCFLCGKTTSSYSHFQLFSTEEQEYVLTHYGMLHNTTQTCICKSDYIEVKRHWGDENYIPKWKKPPPRRKVVKYCSLPGCDSSSEKCRMITPSSAFGLQIQQAVWGDREATEEITLCVSHYNEWYKKVHGLDTPCASCGACPKWCKPFTRHSPDPQAINTHYANHPELEHTNLQLSGEDVICLDCYMVQTEILRPNKLLSRDGDLESLITQWKEDLNHKSLDRVTTATLKTVIHVSDRLLQNKAMLLPAVSNVFTQEYTCTGENSQVQELDTGEYFVKFSSRWLLKKLIVHLKHHISYRSVHRKIGTVLYRTGGDLLTSVSWALGERSTLAPCTTEEATSEGISSEQVLNKAGHIVNDMIHTEVARLTKSQYDPQKLDIDDYLSNINPHLCSFIETITKSVRSNRVGADSASDSSTTKKMRRFNILCQLLFCTNSSCATPLHYLLADTIEICGGSRQLIRIFNRLGSVVSNDTHDRFVTSIAELHKYQSIWQHLSPEIGTICTVDNFDKLCRHAMVRFGALLRSFHAATTMVIQPNPKALLDASASIEQSTPQQNSDSHTTEDAPPAKRRRTLQAEVVDKRPLPAREKEATNRYQSLSMEGFVESDSEIKTRENLTERVLGYFAHKYIQESSHPYKMLRDFLTSEHEVASSKVYYMDILDENPDSDETMLYIAEQLLGEFQGKQEYTVIVGDGKTYQHLMNIKKMYSSTLKNLLIFPGDWHTLKNYQPVLMKIYFDSGLKELAMASRFKGETLKSLANCSHFKRTHHFLLQVWEALYLEILAAYNSTSYTTLKSVSEKLGSLSTYDEQSPEEVIARIKNILSETKTMASLLKFVQERAASDDTWKLWQNFVFNDCMAYVALYIGIRSSNWDLRMSGLKTMAPLFTAFDRPCYSKIIPHHLAEYQLFPDDIKRNLESGGFVVSVSGMGGYCVALDEAHEMLINKDMKAAITRPTSEYTQKTVHYLRYRIEAYHNLLSQLFPPNSSPEKTSIYDTSSVARLVNKNIQAIRDVIRSKSLFPVTTTTNRGLLNVFSGVSATHQQSQDMLNCRTIGNEHYTYYIKYNILQKPSTNSAPLHKHRLLTMAPRPSSNKKKTSAKERELKNIEKCLRRRLEWCNKEGNSYKTGLEQYSIYPRALADCEGIPHKGSKAKWTEKLRTRYPDLTVAATTTPEAVVIDTIFLLHTTPLKGQSVSQYADMLMRRHILPHFQSGATEVHLVFDQKCSGEFNPKQSEQERRDKHSRSNHTHMVDFRPQSITPRPWQDYINCRECKYAIMEAIGLSYMQIGSTYLNDEQQLILGGCFGSSPAPHSAWKVSTHSLVPQPQPMYASSAVEADSRIWRHVSVTSKKHILVYSPDTDVYNIGIGFGRLLRDKDINVKHNQSHKGEKYINLNTLLKCLERDPNLATLAPEEIGVTFQTIFITSGCNYISYFSGYGKVSFLKTLYENARFICNRSLEGSLAQTGAANKGTGFLAFLRLIGSLYFKKHWSAFATKFNCETPEQLFNSLAQSDYPQHESWIDTIREVVSERVLSEDERLPSTSALSRHWDTTCWVSQFWQSSTQEDIMHDLPKPECSGWCIESGKYCIDWDSPELQERVRGTIEFLTKGCTCKKSRCLTNQCSCKRNGRACGPGCKCRDCSNRMENSESEHEMNREERESNEEVQHEMNSEESESADEEYSEDEPDEEVECEICALNCEECESDEEVEYEVMCNEQ